MTNTIAKIRKGGKHFEILVDMEDALKFKKGEIQSITAETDKIFLDIKKGDVASQNDLQEAFGTTDINEIIQKIIKEGDVQTTQEHRSAEQEAKFKQVVNFLSTNAIDPQTGNSISSERIKSALKEAHVNIKDSPIENQIKEIIEHLVKIIPIKLETKKVKITIPAIHTGKAYGVITQFKEKEEWLNDGALQVIVSVPSGMIMDFYDKLNSVTHGSALTEEIKEE